MSKQAKPSIVFVHGTDDRAAAISGALAQDTSKTAP